MRRLIKRFVKTLDRARAAGRA